MRIQDIATDVKDLSLNLIWSKKEVGGMAWMLNVKSVKIRGLILPHKL